MSNARDNELKSGDILFGPIGGFVPGLMPVGIGQAALFLSRRWWKMVRSPRRWFRIRHVAMISVWEQISPPYLTQAMPGGCETIRFDPARHLTDRHIFIRPDYAVREITGAEVARKARHYRDTPYNFLTYLKLAAVALRMPATETWLKSHMSTRRDMMCSQLVDQALADAGFHVFDDGRLPQDVVPAELFAVLMDLPGWFMIPGHPQFGQWTPTSMGWK